VLGGRGIPGCWAWRLDRDTTSANKEQKMEDFIIIVFVVVKKVV
jgi:hypothetical protein